MSDAAFTHVHASGFHGATLSEVATDWDNFRSMPGVRLITGTEHGSGRHDPAFEADGWKGYRGRECVVMWRQDTFELAWEPSFRPLGRRTFFRGGNDDAKVWLTSVPLRHLETGRIVMVRVCHMPASVQDGGRFRRSEARKVAAWSSALARWGHRCRRFKRDHPRAAEIDVADWNVDLKRRRWRGLIATGLGLRCAWDKPLPDRGSHGPRLIDGAFVRNLHVDHARVLDKGRSSDHRPIAYRFAVTNRES